VSELTGHVRTSGFYGTLGPNPSGPAAPSVFRFLIFFITSLTLNWTVVRTDSVCRFSGSGASSALSLVKTSLKQAFSSSPILWYPYQSSLLTGFVISELVPFDFSLTSFGFYKKLLVLSKLADSHRTIQVYNSTPERC
jgi:hypothetical protein